VSEKTVPSSAHIGIAAETIEPTVKAIENWHLKPLRSSHWRPTRPLKNCSQDSSAEEPVNTWQGGGALIRSWMICAVKAATNAAISHALYTGTDELVALAHLGKST
jgi:hypothetical protein